MLNIYYILVCLVIFDTWQTCDNGRKSIFYLLLLLFVLLPGPTLTKKHELNDEVVHSFYD